MCQMSLHTEFQVPVVFCRYINPPPNLRTYSSHHQPFNHLVSFEDAFKSSSSCKVSKLRYRPRTPNMKTFTSWYKITEV